MNTKELVTRTPNMALAATLVALSASVLFGGFAIPSVYAKIIRFETPFESSLIPACSEEEVAFSGVARFTFKETTDNDGNVRQTVTMDYFNVKAQGIASGTKYLVHEHDDYVTLLEGSTTTFETVVKGSFIGQGNAVNTDILMHLVTSIDENGNPHTIVDKVVVKCNGEHFS
jgi:hypothetical protein